MNKLLYLSRKDIEEINLPMHEIIMVLEDMFKSKGLGQTEMPPKPGIHPKKDSFIHAMPAYIPSLGAAGIKWVSGFPDNYKINLPYITGLLILNDPDTGIPISVMDATWITAKRTGAATAVAAKYLARKKSSSVGILGCGVQGRSNLEALACLFKITKVKAFDINLEASKKYVMEMEKIIPYADFEIVKEPKEAVIGMDLIVTSGPILKDTSPIIERGWMAEGAFASAVDFDSYWQGNALQQLDKIATDDKEQMLFYCKEGYFKNTPTPYADLGEIVSGLKPGREKEEERNIAMNLGLALDDMATAVLIYKYAKEKGIGTELPL